MHVDIWTGCNNAFVSVLQTVSFYFRSWGILKSLRSRQKNEFKPDGEISLLTSLISTQAVHIADSRGPSPFCERKQLTSVGVGNFFV